MHMELPLTSVEVVCIDQSNVGHDKGLFSPKITAQFLKNKQITKIRES